MRAARGDRGVILILNVGGPSQLDTWDPKPDAPAEVRGPFRAIRTSVPGLFLSELFPRQARIAHWQAFVRACHHAAPAVHQVGWQVAQTGRDDPACDDAPLVGDVVEQLMEARRGVPAQVTWTGSWPAGASAGAGSSRTPWAADLVSREPDRIRRWYGRSRFGRACLAARCLIEAGVRCVTIRTFEHYGEPGSWDVHGGPQFGNVASMCRTAAPMYDQAYAALLEDLAQRGLLDSTLVCSVAEFGRTPRMNPAGGRDHWPLCWTTTFAGGGVRGGQAVGASDAHGGEPADRPVTPAEIVGSIYYSLGLIPDSAPRQAVQYDAVPITPAMRPIEGLF